MVDEAKPAKQDETDQQNRRLLVEKLLDVFPENIVVQGRTPAIMQNIVQTDDAITEEESFDGSIKSRVGHHNDCFLANASDYGTYRDLAHPLDKDTRVKFEDTVLDEYKKIRPADSIGMVKATALA